MKIQKKASKSLKIHKSKQPWSPILFHKKASKSLKIHKSKHPWSPILFHKRASKSFKTRVSCLSAMRSRVKTFVISKRTSISAPTTNTFKTARSLMLGSNSSHKLHRSSTSLTSKQSTCHHFVVQSWLLMAHSKTQQTSTRLSSSSIQT